MACFDWLLLRLAWLQLLVQDAYGAKYKWHKGLKDMMLSNSISDN